MEVIPANAESTAIRVEFFGDEIDRIVEVDVLTGEIKGELKHAAIFPASHYVVDKEKMAAAIENIKEELGDVLFSAVNVARFYKLDSEQLMHAACEKFIRRFRAVEALADRPLEELDVPALEALWRRAKAEDPQAT